MLVAAETKAEPNLPPQPPFHPNTTVNIFHQLPRSHFVSLLLTALCWGGLNNSQGSSEGSRKGPKLMKLKDFKSSQNTQEQRSNSARILLHWWSTNSFLWSAKHRIRHGSCPGWGDFGNIIQHGKPELYCRHWQIKGKIHITQPWKVRGWSAPGKSERRRRAGT